jgi:hypothetical protein
MNTDRSSGHDLHMMGWTVNESRGEAHADAEELLAQSEAADVRASLTSPIGP